MHRHRDACSALSDAVRTTPELGEMARRFYPQLCHLLRLSNEQHRVLCDIMRCRTAALGGHLDVCPHCGHERPSYNSCLNRHCPKCQWLACERWLDERKGRLLPTHHFHVVFTVPEQLRELFNQNPKLLYALLFQCASSALLELARDEKRLGAQLGITAVLHTWTRDLRLHPHLHCIVTGGGLKADGQWASTKPGFLFPSKVLGKLFQGKFLHALKTLYDKHLLRLDARCQSLLCPDAFQKLLDKLYRKKWRPYCKKPLAGAQQVCQYLARYSHRTAISNHRLLSCDANSVRFRTRSNCTTKLSIVAFFRRFLQHVLPTGFVRIRHYGLYASANVNGRLIQARASLEQQNLLTDSSSAVGDDKSNNADCDKPDFVKRMLDAFGIDPMQCPLCGSRLLRQKSIPRQHSLIQTRSPPYPS